MIELEIQQKIDRAILSRPDMQAGSFELRMSSAGDCPRLLDYKLQRGQKAKDLKDAMRLLTGEPIHEFYRTMLRESFPDGDYCMSEEEVTLQLYSNGVPLGKPILGHIDGYIASLKATVEIKSVGTHVYGMVVAEGRPLPTNLRQGNLYTGCVKGAEQTLFIYHCRDTGEYTMFLVPFMESLFQEVCDKFLAARIRQQQKMMIDRPYHDATLTPCWFCEWKDECYEGFAQEIKEFDETVAEGTMLEDALRYIELREIRLGAEKNEGEMKQAMIASMSKQKISRLKTSKAALILSAGKNNNSLLAIKEVKS